MNERAPIRNRIRRMRFDHDEMTQQELADRVGVTRQTILAIEAGKYNPSLLVALRIARTFGTKVDEVFYLEDSEAEDSGAGHLEDGGAVHLDNSGSVHLDDGGAVHLDNGGAAGPTSTP
jgi:putative transcriptional regulator